MKLGKTGERNEMIPHTSEGTGDLGILEGPCNYQRTFLDTIAIIEASVLL